MAGPGEEGAEGGLSKSFRVMLDNCGSKSVVSLESCGNGLREADPAFETLKRGDSKESKFCCAGVSGGCRVGQSGGRRKSRACGTRACLASSLVCLSSKYDKSSFFLLVGIVRRDIASMTCLMGVFFLADPESAGGASVSACVSSGGAFAAAAASLESTPSFNSFELNSKS